MARLFARLSSSRGAWSMWLYRLTALLLLANLSACGFHMQGMLTVPPDMRRTYIQAADTHSLFYRELRRELLAEGIELTEDEAAADAVFSILADDTGQRVLSVSARNVPTEYEVYYTIEYGITSGADVLLPVQVITLTRDYTYDSTLVLGKAKEEQLLRGAIVKDLVRVVREQISAQ